VFAKAETGWMDNSFIGCCLDEGCLFFQSSTSEIFIS
jgi:hypothetical protein